MWTKWRSLTEPSTRPNCWPSTNTFSGGKCKPCVEPPAEMSAWWTMDETGGFVSRDIAGGNHGEWSGSPTPMEGKVDVSLFFNGIDQHLKVPSHPSINFKASQSFTIDAWIRPNSLDNRRGALVSKVDPNTGVGYHLSHRSGRLIFSMSDGSSAVFNYVSPQQITRRLVDVRGGDRGSRCGPRGGLR